MRRWNYISIKLNHLHSIDFYPCSMEEIKFQIINNFIPSKNKISIKNSYLDYIFRTI